MDAGDQQPFAAFGRQQFDRVGNAQGGAGQRHDAIGLAFDRHFLLRDLRGKPEEAARQQQTADNRDRHREKADPADETRKHQSIDSSVRLTVWRDVTAVTAAVNVTCANTPT